MKNLKTFKIENAPHKFFEDKEHYLAFRKAWKSFINSKKHLKYSNGTYTTTVWDSTTKCYKNSDPIPNRAVSDLTFVHHLLYAAFRGRDLGANIIPDSVTDTYSLLWNEIKYAEMYLNNELDGKMSVYSKERTEKANEKLLAPFGGTITKQMISDILKQIPRISEWEDKT